MATFTVDGVEYAMLEDDLTLDEAGWFYDIAGVGVEAIGEDDQGDKLKKAKALMCIAIARARPEVPHREIEDRIGSLKVSELEHVFAIDPGAQSPPPESASAEPSESSGEASSGDSGSSPDAADLPPSGFPRSDIMSDSDREIAVGLHRVN